MTVDTNSPQAQSNARDSRWMALVVLCMGFLMIILDTTIVNVALPSIQRDLHYSQSNLAWVMNAYLIAFGGLLLLAGRLGDLVGRKRIFMVGLIVFTVASAICGLAGSKSVLVGARFVQGIGGALTSAVILGMIVTMFTEPGERTKAIGIYSFVASAGASLGLLLGGVLTQTINWHWIFFVNLPIGIVTGILATRVINRDEGLGLGEGADVPGAFLLVSSLMLGVYTIVEASRYGWSSARTLGFGAVAVGLLVGFVFRESRVRQPLVPLRIFRSRIVSAANSTQALFIAGMFGMFFLGALFMQGVLGYGALEVGLAFLPLALGIASMSLSLAPKLITRFGARETLLPSLVLVVIGLALFARAPADATYWTDILPSMVLLGIGAGVIFPAVMTLAMSGATETDSGLASGLVNTTQQVGGALGLAVLATLSTAHTKILLARGHSNASALTSGYHLAFTIGAALVVASIVLVITVLRPRATRAGAEASTDGVEGAQPELAYAWEEAA